MPYHASKQDLRSTRALHAPRLKFAGIFVSEPSGNHRHDDDGEIKYVPDWVIEKTGAYIVEPAALGP